MCKIWPHRKIIFLQMHHIILHGLCAHEPFEKWAKATLWPGDRLNIKMSSYQYRDPHVKDKTVSRPSSLRDRLLFNMGIPIPCKTVFILRRRPDERNGQMTNRLYIHKSCWNLFKLWLSAIERHRYKGMITQRIGQVHFWGVFTHWSRHSELTSIPWLPSLGLLKRQPIIQ